MATAGEEAVLAAILEVAGPHSLDGRGSRIRVGPGDDDAAVLSPPWGAQQVMTTDTMSHGQDFRLSWWSDPERAARDIGIKAAAQNLSDLNAMGAAPAALLVSLTLPPTTTVDWVRQFYRGLLEACARPGAEECVLAGGDLGSGEQISVTVTAVGDLAEDSPGLRRSGARPGDVLAVAGQLGSAAAGLALLERFGAAAQTARHQEAAAQTAVRRCLRAQMRPDPPLTAGPVALAGGAAAGMDLSDGLLRDAGRMAQASAVRIVLDDQALRTEAESLVPAAEALRADPLEWVLTGGEDYSLLAAFPSGVVLPEGFRRIGTVQAGKPGVSTELSSGRTGWDSLQS